MKRKGIAAVLVLSMMLAFAGCSKKETNEAAASTEGKGTVVETGTTELLKLGNYKGVEVEASDVEVTEDEVQDQVEYDLESNAYLQEIEGKTVIEEGDIVNIDYRGLIDGEEFEGGTSGEGGYDLEIGSGLFIEGFEDQLIGKELGGSYDLDLQFPEDYGKEELNGKPVIFEVTVNKIQERLVPELTDEFVQEKMGYDSVDAYREGVRQELESAKLDEAQSLKEYNVLSAVIGNSEFELAADEVEALKSSMVETYESYASVYGMDMDTFLAIFMGGTTMEDFEAECERTAEFRIKSNLIIDAVAEEEGITVSDEEYTQEAEKIMGDYGFDTLEDFEGQYTKEAIMENVRYNKTLNFLVGQAVEI